MKSQSPSPAPPTLEPELIVGTAAAEADALLKDLAEQKDLHLRLLADFENFKRRSRQESEARAAAQKESFIVELLPVIDNLERALAASASRDSSPFHQGVEMTLTQLQQLLRQHGVESEALVGQPLSQARDPAQPDHAILTVLQRGYQRGQKIIRPAKVVVNEPAPTQQGHHGR